MFTKLNCPHCKSNDWSCVDITKPVHLLIEDKIIIKKVCRCDTCHKKFEIKSTYDATAHEIC